MKKLAFAFCTLIIATMIGFNPTTTRPVRAIVNGFSVPSGFIASAIVMCDPLSGYCSGVLTRLKGPALESALSNELELIFHSFR